MKQYLSIITLAALSLLAASGCRKDDLQVKDDTGDLISFAVNQSNYWNNNAAETKGEMITGSTLGEYNIGIKAFMDNTSTIFIDDQIEHVNDDHSYALTGAEGAGHWAPIENHTYYWPKVTKLDFWAWAPYENIKAAIDNESAGKAVKISNFTVNNETGAITFGYDLGTTTAIAQPDLMFATIADMNKAKAKELNDTGCVPLAFKHALSAVQFNVKVLHGGYVSTISLGNIAKTGTCSFNGDFTWSNNTGKDGTFSQDFETTLPAKTYSEFYKTSTEKTFMMIPQAIAANTKTISISISSAQGIDPIVYSGKIPAGTWEPGKVYVYNIEITETGMQIKVTVNPWVDVNGGNLTFNGTAAN